MKSFSELTSASQVNNEDLLAISQTSGSGYASKKTTVKDITDKSNLNLAEEYDSTSTYAVDDYVIYESVLYKCIGTTTGTFDSTKWTSVVVTDEMGSGGGGGTGGHTIIDENGNSMPARAGLQFVGANVSDDSTNNKTIVDLASAGGFGLVQSGHTVYTLTGQNLEVRVPITFDTPFPEVPNVALSLSDPSRGQYYNPQTGLGVTNVTENGFEILIKSSDSAVAGDITIYWIATTKFSGNGIFHPIIYSLEERVIGIWKDGKPLYQKTLVVASVGSVGSSLVSPIEITDIPFDFVTVINANVYDNADKRWYPITSHAKTDSDTIFIRPYLNKDANPVIFYASLYTGGNTYSNLGELNVTIQYTKSTDTAGSGSWTPQGVPAVHYSTEEHIVGTWTDGKTLWEKAIEFGALPDTTTKNVAHNIASVDKIWVYDGFVYGNSGQTFQLNRPTNAFAYQWETTVDRTNVSIQDFANFSNDFSAVVVVRYTKTS